jgi:hypothetical protein
MTAVSGKKGRELLLDVINEMKRLDPKIVPFDSDEIEDLEINVSSSVRDVFGEGSPEYADFEEFHIAAGHISRGDSRVEKQGKFELGLPKAISRLEELLDLIDSSDKKKSSVKDLSPNDLVAMEAVKKPAPSRSPADKPVPAKALTTPAAVKKETVGQKPKPAPGISKDQPGKILLLQSGGDDITFAVTALMDKIGIDVVMLEEDSSSNVRDAVSKDKIAFTLLCVSSGQKGGLSGLTAVIAKPRPKHEVAFKLGLLVGRLGAGKVAILYNGEKPMDIPEDLFGVLYLPYQEEGGWQIGLLKLLKSNAFFIDANLLFD